LRSDIEIRKPETKQEFEQYYNLRWQILRQPWSQPKGSEQDEIDKNSTHFMAIIGNRIIGCGRGHFNSDTQAQIRYMAVDESFQGQGIGLRILKTLEDYLTGNGAKEIILKAREKAVPFYEKQGYEIFEEGKFLFGEIKHYWMRKK